MAVSELKAQLKRLRPRLLAAGLALVTGLAVWGSGSTLLDPRAAWTPSDPPNSPLGVAKGIYPGRVTWARNTDATPWNGTTGHWWDDNTGVNQTAVEQMMSRSLRTLSGATNDVNAWDKIFRFYNSTHGRGDIGYQTNETIALKINCNNCYDGNLDVDNQIDAAPQSVLAMLRQLVNKAGVLQSNITVYEAVRYVPNRIITKCRSEFPSVIWMDSGGTNGFCQKVSWHSNAFNYSGTAYLGNSIPERVFQASYLINMSLLKGHWHAGVSLTAKNHLGSINGAPFDHTCIDSYLRAMPIYHPFVDLMGAQQLGGKTVLFIMDGLYGIQEVTDLVNATTASWSNLFGGLWSASCFMSFDPVAIDSVGLDFLRSEFGDNLGHGHTDNCDNYMHEAALANSPPSGTDYRPDGLRLASLGAHEHWNNATNKQYSRNLSPGGTGIELVPVHNVTGISAAINSPANGATFVCGVPVTLEASATANYSMLRKLDFYSSGSLLGTATNNPFNLVWSNPPAGAFALTAVATDSDGLTATSSVVNITIRTNSSPALAAISNCCLNAGMTLTVTNAATDCDAPPQTLTFSLRCAPTGAVIGADSGLLIWRPAVIQADTTNLFSVEVADDGTPSLCATQHFWVTVNKLERPALNVTTLGAGQFQIQVRGDAGPNYQIQTSTNLANPANWITMFTTNSPPLPFIWIDTNVAGHRMLFYRTLLGP